MHQLEELDISYNFLDTVSEHIYLLPKLQVLNLQGNKLQAMPDLLLIRLQVLSSNSFIFTTKRMLITTKFFLRFEF